MSTATLSGPDTNLARLSTAGITLDHLSPEMRAQIDHLGVDEIQTLIDLKRRFTGELALDPTLYEGSNDF